jgi:3-hydroxyisobutyrate dehydrogenase-like beta-hydroxyacid dehydrogenase
MTLMQKDVELALDAARRLEIPVPTAERAGEILKEARSLGYERRDIAAFFQLLDELAAERRKA